MNENFKSIAVHQLGISRDLLAQAEQLAEEEMILLPHALIRLGSTDPKTLLRAYAHSRGLQLASLDDMDIPINIIELIPPSLAREVKAIPIDRVGNNIIIALVDPHNLQQLDLIRFKTGYQVKPVLASEAQIKKSIEKYYPLQGMDIDELSKKNAHGVNPSTSNKQDKRKTISENISEESGPIIQIVDQILIQCLSRKASDIHIEPYESFMRVRLRIDGVLHEIARPPEQFKLPLTSRFKIMAHLNIAEKRLPQDGSISVNIQGKPIDFRVNTIPTVYGEKIVLRVLDKSALNVDLTQLGFTPKDLDRFKSSIHKPFGMVLVTGPTGSGKTTTLYSALSDLNKTTENIITAEDPVEFTIDGINQIQINSQIGMTFASALRAFLRQDPDIIMVGEIRDKETAEISIKAALTGHLVLSTLHTNSAPDTITRLQNMGVESFNIISALNSIVAQRLARKICAYCKSVDREVTPESLVSIGVPFNEATRIKVYKGTGCQECSHTGTLGRIAIHEVMIMDESLKEAILNGAPANQIKHVAMKSGMKSLRQNALIKLVQGEISIVEVVKTTSSDQADT